MRLATKVGTMAASTYGLGRPLRPKGLRLLPALPERGALAAALFAAARTSSGGMGSSQWGQFMTSSIGFTQVWPAFMW